MNWNLARQSQGITLSFRRCFAAFPLMPLTNAERPCQHYGFSPDSGVQKSNVRDIRCPRLLRRLNLLRKSTVNLSRHRRDR